MNIKWTKCNNAYPNTLDITHIISSVNWGGSTSQAARTAEIAVVNALDDKNVTNLKIATGDTIKLYENNNLIFMGEVITKEATNEIGTITYSCIDLLNHLLKSTGTYNFSNTTAEKITKKVCTDFEIKTAFIEETNTPIKKMIIDSSNIYDIIMMAYTKAAKQTGNKYICSMNGSELTVKKKGTVVKEFILAEGYNITNINYEETIDNMVNLVKIYDDKGKQIGEVKKDKWVEKYGVYQQVYKKEKGINAEKAANNMLKGIEKKVTLDGINGNINCIAGNGVQVYDNATGLNGVFWIENDTHTWENGTHTMSLELNFKNVMNRKEYEETEETKK